MGAPDTLWYRDAVFYELHVKAFQDSAQDGVGDFGGLIQRLDYVRDLGVDAIWLLPFYPSPLRDDGYDIADYYSTHPQYGTIEDFQRFLDDSRGAVAPKTQAERDALFRDFMAWHDAKTLTIEKSVPKEFAKKLKKAL